MRYLFLLSLVLLISCQPKEKEYSGKEILEKSIQKHDPRGQWNTAEFTLRIQEPRLQNPVRFSLVYLNNKTNAFKLMRNREDKIASYGINDKGIITVLLDTKAVEDSISIQRYLLQEARVKVYQNSYQTMLGLPMTLNNDFIENIRTVSKESFNGKSAFKLELTLKRKVFSDRWNVYFSQDDFTLLGIDVVSHDNPSQGERLYFEKSIQARINLLAYDLRQ